ncbi:MAG: pyridoxal-phosphate dependent enzyme, partial [Candidatus Peregrinibacteria bacterium]|nr:pyridoxal-phosphate dependent enzyme [Candidatus Peregrinibacteria bacterium]
FVPIGGGGLSAGISEYLKQKGTKTEVFICETTGKQTAKKSLEAGTNIELEKVDAFSDGTAVKKLGDKTFAVIKNNFDLEHVIQCPEGRVAKTILAFLFHEGIILEPAGALSVDSLRSVRDHIRGKKIVCVISGGNFDFERLPDIKERAMKFAGTKKYFILRLPQRPGALKEFLGLLGPGDDIARFEYLKKSAKNFGSVLLGIETDKPENFDRFYAGMSAAGFEFSDVTEDEILADFVI